MLLTYILASLALIIKPGPDLLCTIAIALTHGRRRALCFMWGLIFGCWLWILLLSLGVAAFLKSHAVVMDVIRYGGMAYIAYLAFGSLKEAWMGFRHPEKFDFTSLHEKGVRLFARGIAMAMSNPLTIMFFLAFLPHFTSEGSSLSPSVQILLLGTLFCSLVPFVSGPIIFTAGALKSVIERKKGLTPLIKLVSGLLLSVVVLLLAFA